MEESVHITFSEDSEAISQSSSEGDAINFNENISFPEDEFVHPKNTENLCTANTEYFPFSSAYEATPITLPIQDHSSTEVPGSITKTTYEQAPVITQNFDDTVMGAKCIYKIYIQYISKIISVST